MSNIFKSAITFSITLEKLGETRPAPYLVPGGYGAEVFEDVMPMPCPENQIQPAFTNAHWHLANKE